MSGYDRDAGVSAAEAPPDDAVREALARVLESHDFRGSARRRAFLGHVVEETLAGRADRLKGYAIAVSVFGRAEDFDPQADPVVRLEAGRLRRDLDGYYAGEGARDPLRISIPRGGYVPRFDRLPDPQASPEAAAPEPAGPAEGPQPASVTPGRRKIAKPAAFGALLLTVVLSVAAALGGLGRGAHQEPATAYGPAVAVLPFHALGGSKEARDLARGLGESVIGDLMRFPGFRLFTLPRPAGGAAAVAPETLAALGVAYVVDGGVRAEGGDVRVTTQLREAATGQVIWSGVYERAAAPDALMALEADLAGEIAGALGQPYGAVASDLARRANAAAGGVETLPSYICVLRAFAYRRSFSPEEHASVLVCLEETVRRDPGYADAWAMLGWLRMDTGRFDAWDRDPGPDYDAGAEAARHALQLDPNDLIGLSALAAIEHYRGNYALSLRLGRQALEMNPYDPELLAQVGWRLMARGDSAEGLPMLERAIDRTANPPAWYYHLIAVDLLMKGDYDRMREVAERSARDGTSAFSQALIAMASAAQGDRAATRAALKRMSAGSEVLDRDPELFFRRNGVTEEIGSALSAALRRAREIAAGA